MDFKEQFLTKKFDEEQLLKGYVNNMSYEDYVYYVACLSEYLYKKRKYQASLFFYDHLVRSVGCTIILEKYEQAGRKIQPEFEKYKVNLEEFTNSKEAEKLGKKIDKIAGLHTTKKFVFQIAMIIVGTIVAVVLSYLKIDSKIGLIAGLLIAAAVPLFYKPKPITIDHGVTLSKNLEYVARYNKDLIDYIKNKINKDKKFKEIRNN